MGGLAPQGRAIAGRSELQCCNRSRHTVGRRRYRAGVTDGVLLGHCQVPGRDGRQGSSPGGRPGPAAWPSGGVIAGGACCSAATAQGPCWPVTAPNWNHWWAKVSPCSCAI
ncbi:hypothetical protein H2136_20825 [Aeromonas hydrophila]|uniref:Uncharacterized protein n=1 Tax=Aeromonas hydrophila TaxID=644 RepID=A0A926FNR8_AERHY|nr:hypothetical protein [Aeromonas hydrophila]